MRILVTGGAGFIGSHLVKRLIRADDVERVTVLDALTYAGHLSNLGEAFSNPKLHFMHGDIRDAKTAAAATAGQDAVVHLAAESHVDRSLADAGAFVETNVLGTHLMVEAARLAGVDRFVHVSTDEVYGSISEGAAAEDAPLHATVPYAAAKAASDLIALSAWRTHAFPVCVTRSANNYGPNQHPEKILPRSITRLFRGEKVTLHGRGEHVRNWLWVEDNAAGIELVLRSGEPGEVYNLGDGTELDNNALLDRILPLCGATRDRIEYVPDRQANDLRYAMECAKARALGYQPRKDLDEGLAETVAWYQAHPDRWAPLLREIAVPLSDNVFQGAGR